MTEAETRRQRIEQALLGALAPTRMLLVNESHQHSGAKTDTHWNLILVSDAFCDRTRVQRQQAVHAALATEFATGLHAITMKLLTQAEWNAAGGEVANPAPPCRGGSKRGSGA